MTNVVCDLILLSWNNLSETQACLESLFQWTDAPSRLIMVDNGSEPDVRAFLATVKPRGAVQAVELIQNDVNEGFPRGMNHGLRASRAPYACLLNNDLRLAPGWLGEMLAVAQAHPIVGILNPLSNTLGYHVPPGLTLEQYGQQRHVFHGQYTEVSKCTGFCFLVAREVIERIGLLSEDVDRCFFEDEDFCMRAQQAGYTCGVAMGAYVYHAEHRSVDLVPERERLFRKNRQWCEAKWGRWVRIAWPRMTPIEPGSPELRAWLERLQRWARRRAYVSVYSPLKSGITKEQLFRSVGLVPHAGVRLHPLPYRGARWVAIGAIAARQRKRFDVITAPDPAWRTLMRGFRWLHRAEVVLEQNDAELEGAWQRRARRPRASPKSSQSSGVRETLGAPRMRSL